MKQNLLSQIPINSPSVFKNSDTLVGDIVSKVLVYAIGIAGLYFFVRTVLAGFTLLTSAGDPAKAQSAQQGLTHALIGLVIVISSFFIAQIIQTIFGIKIL